MPAVPSSTRSALLKSWDAARRQADRTGAILLNHASFAGYALAIAGSPRAAIDLVPRADGSLFYARVIAILQSLEHEEREAPAAAAEVSA
jgi:hypothetical protein